MATPKKSTPSASKAVASKAASVTPAGRAAKVVAKKAAAKKPAGGAAPAAKGGKRGAAPRATAAPGTAPTGGGRSRRAIRATRTAADKGRAGYGATQGFLSRRLTSRGALLSEFLVCMVLIGIGFMLSDNPQTQGTQAALRLTGVCGVFLVLGLVAAGGEGARKFSTAVGLLVLLALMFNDRDVFKQITSWSTGALKKTTGGTGGG